jgi:hypothetical protein
MTFALTIITAADRARAAEAEAVKAIERAVDARIEAQAAALGYSSAAQLAGYANSTVENWMAEARRFIAWRDETWLAVYAQQAEAKERGAAPGLETVLAALPEWKREAQ